VATFSGSGGTQISLDLPNPTKLAALNFSGANYTLTGGTLEMQQGTTNTGTSSITVTGGTQTIGSTVQISGGSLAIAISGNGQLAISGDIGADNPNEALTLSSPDATGQLILSGTNTYAGGTNVLSGTLVVQSSAGIFAGSNLTVGADAAAVFGSPLEGGAAVPAPVPEPGSVALLLAALGGAAVYGRSRRRSKTAVM
jgi:autotransporter-associated beta strand protein